MYSSKGKKNKNKSCLYLLDKLHMESIVTAQSQNLFILKTWNSFDQYSAPRCICPELNTISVQRDQNTQAILTSEKCMLYNHCSWYFLRRPKIIMKIKQIVLIKLTPCCKEKIYKMQWLWFKVHITSLLQVDWKKWK